MFEQKKKSRFQKIGIVISQVETSVPSYHKKTSDITTNQK